MNEFFQKYGTAVTKSQVKYLIIKLDDNTYSNQVTASQIAKCLYTEEDSGLPIKPARLRLNSANRVTSKTQQLKLL